jgi:phosphoglycolate phosphatase
VTALARGRFRGIVFDLDGTLVDSNIDFRKMKSRMISLLEENGAPRGVLTPEQTNVVIMEKAERLWEEQGKPRRERQRLRDMITRIMDEGEMEAVDTLTAIRGAPEAVHRLKRMGYRLAILTRSHHDYAVKALQKTGMIADFDIILGRGETPQPKPYAEAMTHAAKLMGLSLDEVLMVGDHQIDATCALNARCHFVGVATGPRGDKSWEGGRPEVVLSSVSELPSFLESKE